MRKCHSVKRDLGLGCELGLLGLVQPCDCELGLGCELGLLGLVQPKHPLPRGAGSHNPISRHRLPLVVWL